MKSTNTDKTSQEVASILLRIGSVLFRPKQPFRFDSGILSPVYVDNRYLIAYPKERKLIIRKFLKIINKIGRPDIIAGLATAGIPYASWIAKELNLPMIYVRSIPKDHGKGNQVEGYLKQGQKVLLVEDLISTAGTSVRAAQAVRKLGGIVDSEIAIYTHDLKESVDNLQRAKINLHYLTDTHEVAKIAHEQGYLNSEQVDIILDWTKNPKSWAKKMGFK